MVPSESDIVHDAVSTSFFRYGVHPSARRSIEMRCWRYADKCARRHTWASRVSQVFLLCVAGQINQMEQSKCGRQILIPYPRETIRPTCEDQHNTATAAASQFTKPIATQIR